MYLHLGAGVVVALQDLVGIFDSRLLQENEDNQRFIASSRKSGRIMSEVPPADCKAVVVTTTGVYTSAISSLTLQKRATHVQWGLSEGQSG